MYWVERSWSDLLLLVAVARSEFFQKDLCAKRAGLDADCGDQLQHRHDFLFRCSLIERPADMTAHFGDVADRP